MKPASPALLSRRWPSARCRCSPPSNYIVGVAISALIFTVAAAALNLVYGFTGLLSFAQLGFWGIGGYATALTVDDLRRQFLDGRGLCRAAQRRRGAGRSAIRSCAPTAMPS